jgi:hypothetical protein
MRLAGASLKHIADVLRHRSLDTTAKRMGTVIRAGHDRPPSAVRGAAVRMQLEERKRDPMREEHRAGQSNSIISSGQRTRSRWRAYPP